MQTVTKETICAAIDILALPSLDEEETDRRVLELVDDETTMRRLVDWPPEAFGLVAIAHNWKKVIRPSTFLARNKAGEWTDFPFRCEPIFVDSLEIGQRLFLDGNQETFRNVALRGSMLNTIDRALRQGSELDGAVLSGPALIGIPAEIYTLPKKTFWQNLFG